jgi:glycosyltransferase involved in cell wall biosynthesis
MKLAIFHYHFRPGGVRRVIELALPHLMRVIKPRIDAVVLAGGEAPDSHWTHYLTEKLPRMSVELPTDPAMGYFGESGLSPAMCMEEARRAVEKVLQGANRENCVVWAHNMGLARNPFLAKALAEVTARRQILLLEHHHDWWFDNRWQRWPELRNVGFRSLSKTANLLFPAQPNIRHVAINRADFALLHRNYGDNAQWMPNLMECGVAPDDSQVKAARFWLKEIIGKRAPVWLYPCRLLRRKNIAEALLLMRWLRPGAWLVTTGGPSSPGERAYAETLSRAAACNRWPIKLGVLKGREPASPKLPELFGASETVISTSIQEGFGLPFLEASAAGRPLIARALPNIFPDLKDFGFHFPQAYEDVWIDPALFDWAAEQNRQKERFLEWWTGLPSSCREWVGKPQMVFGTKAPAPFSRLTLRAQLEVLAHPPEHSWNLCAPLNSFLEPWRHAAENTKLEASKWPDQAGSWLGGDAYARRFQAIMVSQDNAAPSPETGMSTQTDFLRERLAAANLFPLLWSSEP